MIRNTLTYKYAVGMGIFLTLYWIVFIVLFKYGQHFINGFYMVGGAIGLILAILYMLVVLISSTICILLPLIDLFIFKPKSTDKKVSKIRVIIECLFVNFYLLNAIPICFYFISDQISRL